LLTGFKIFEVVPRLKKRKLSCPAWDILSLDTDSAYVGGSIFCPYMLSTHYVDVQVGRGDQLSSVHNVMQCHSGCLGKEIHLFSLLRMEAWFLSLAGHSRVTILAMRFQLLLPALLWVLVLSHSEYWEYGLQVVTSCNLRSGYEHLGEYCTYICVVWEIRVRMWQSYLVITQKWWER
jgi:hypothetical protein